MTPTVTISRQAFSQVDVPRFLACIHAVEFRRNHLIGQYGELGPLQFKRETWESLTSMPFEWAVKERESEQVGRFALTKYRYQLANRGLDPGIHNLALCWREGVSAVILHKWANKNVGDYAERVAHLYRDTTFKPP